jgi:hypothetical protein
MRNNEKRLGLAPGPPHSGTDPPPGSPLAFVTPTEFVELPSNGMFYSEGHPLHRQDTVEIKFMTAKEEDILTSETLIKKGVVIDRLIDNLLADQRIKARTLLIGDRNAIIIAARISAYGNEYDTVVTCPDCSEESKNSCNLEEIEHINACLEEEFLNQENLSFDQENNVFNIPLPRSQATVGVKLLNGSDQKELSSQKKENSAVTDLLKRIIVSVNENHDRNVINNFVDSLPATDSKHIRKLYAKLVPNVEIRQDFVCVYCGHTSDLEVPFTAAFFWPE